MDVISQIAMTIKKHGMIEAGDGIVVALSGGPDSVCLLKALCMLREELELGSITAAHINHGLRGDDSDGDEEYARDLAAELGAGFVSRRYDVEALADEWGLGTEEAGRRVRYEFFEEVRRLVGARRVAVAHNLDDQAETVLMRIMRGTGTRGLAGIPYVRGGGIIIRPLLDVCRTDIEAFCREQGLEPRIDKTNLEPVYNRNKIRLELLPQMEQTFNPEVKQALVRLANQAAEDEDCLQSMAEKEAAGRWNAREQSLELAGFRRLHRAVAKRVLFWCIRKLGLTYNVSAVHVEKLMELIETSGPESPKSTDLVQGWTARIVYNRVWFAEQEKIRQPKKRGKSGAGETGEAGADGGMTGNGGTTDDGSQRTTGAADAVAFPYEELETEGRTLAKVAGRTVRLTLSGDSRTTDVPGSSACFAASGSFEPGENSTAHVSDNSDSLASSSGLKTSERSTAADLKRSDTDSAESGDQVLYRARLDYDLMKSLGSAVIRTRQAGDRFSPRGMKGSKKLQDMMTDRKIPKAERDRIPLIIVEGRALAVGSEVASTCPLSTHTERILVVEILEN